MKRMAIHSILVLATLSVLFCLPGCSMTSAKQKAFDAENMLVSAGFTFKVADSDKKLEKLKSLPQRKLVRHERHGKVTFVYADAASCNCVYLGDEAAYQRLRRLAYSDKLAAKQEKGIWSTTQVSEAATWSTFIDAGDFDGDIDPYLDD